MKRALITGIGVLSIIGMTSCQNSKLAGVQGKDPSTLTIGGGPNGTNPDGSITTFDSEGNPIDENGLPIITNIGDTGGPGGGTGTTGTSGGTTDGPNGGTGTTGGTTGPNGSGSPTDPGNILLGSNNGEACINDSGVTEDIQIVLDFGIPAIDTCISGKGCNLYDFNYANPDSTKYTSDLRDGQRNIAWSDNELKCTAAEIRYRINSLGISTAKFDNAYNDQSVFFQNGCGEFTIPSGPYAGDIAVMVQFYQPGTRQFDPKECKINFNGGGVTTGCFTYSTKKANWDLLTNDEAVSRCFEHAPKI